MAYSTEARAAEAKATEAKAKVVEGTVAEAKVVEAKVAEAKAAETKVSEAKIAVEGSNAGRARRPSRDLSTRGRSSSNLAHLGDLPDSDDRRSNEGGGPDGRGGPARQQGLIKSLKQAGLDNRGEVHAPSPASAMG